MTMMLQQAETWLVVVLLVLVKVVILAIRKDIKAFLAAHTSEKTRALMDTLVKDAGAYVPVMFPGVTPVELAQKLADHVIALAVRKGLAVDSDEVLAAAHAIVATLSPAVLNTVPSVAEPAVVASMPAIPETA